MKEDSSKVFCILGKYLAIVFFITLMSIQSARASEQLYNRTVTKILLYSNEVVFEYTPVGTNKDGCSNGLANKRVYLDLTANDAEIMYATVLSAYMAGKKVGFGVSGCRKFGSTTVPRIYRIELR